MKYKGFDKEDGTILKTAFLDGYKFGDTLLEGVMFKAIVDDAGELKVEVAEGSKAYMQKLNTEKWLMVALGFAVQAGQMGEPEFSEREDGGEDLCLIKET